MLTSARLFTTGVAILFLTSCTGHENAPHEKLSLEAISSQLREMGYEHYPENPTRWDHNPPLSRQEAPRIYIYEDVDGWRVSGTDFDIFYCLPTTRLSPQEAVRRSKEIFATVPAKDRVAVPEHPERGEIQEKDLLCHVGRGG